MSDKTSREWVAQRLHEHGLDTAYATVSCLPTHSGDGYGYGGGAIVTIGSHSIVFGEGDSAYALAKEVANRWNETGTRS